MEWLRINLRSHSKRPTADSLPQNTTENSHLVFGAAGDAGLRMAEELARETHRVGPRHELYKALREPKLRDVDSERSKLSLFRALASHVDLVNRGPRLSW